MDKKSGHLLTYLLLASVSIAASISFVTGIGIGIGVDRLARKILLENFETLIIRSNPSCSNVLPQTLQKSLVPKNSLSLKKKKDCIDNFSTLSNVIFSLKRDYFSKLRSFYKVWYSVFKVEELESINDFSKLLS